MTIATSDRFGIRSSWAEGKPSATSGSPAKRNATPLRRGSRASKRKSVQRSFRFIENQRMYVRPLRVTKQTVAASWGRGRAAAHITMRGRSAFHRAGNLRNKCRGLPCDAFHEITSRGSSTRPSLLASSNLSATSSSNWTDRYPRIVEEAARIRGSAIIDAEVVCLDAEPHASIAYVNLQLVTVILQLMRPTLGWSGRDGRMTRGMKPAGAFLGLPWGLRNVPAI